MSLGIARPKYGAAFLAAVADEVGLKNEQAQVFIVRFDPPNFNQQSSVLAKRCCSDAVDKTQTFLDRVDQSLNALTYCGYSVSEKRRQGRPKRDEEKWKKAYQWLWEVYYPIWLVSYEEKLPARLLAHLLLDLDIYSQKKNFDKILALQPVSSFCIHVSSIDTTNHWVVASFLKRLPRTAQEPSIYRLKALRHTETFDWFWEGLRDYFEDELDPTLHSEELHSKLIELCVERSVTNSCCLIVFLNHCSAEVEKQLWENFWNKIVTHKKIEGLPFGHSFVLLIIRDKEVAQFQDVVNCQSLEDEKIIKTNTHSILLNPILSIKGNEVLQWLKPRGKVLTGLMGDQYSRFGKEVCEWDQSEAIDKTPSAILNKICQHTTIQNGIADVEQYWKSEAV